MRVIFTTEPEDQDVRGYDPDRFDDAEDESLDPDWEFDRVVGRGTTDRHQIYRMHEIAENGF